MKTTLATCIALIAFALPAAAVTATENPEAEKLRTAASAKISDGDYAGAIKDLDEAARLSPDSFLVVSCRADARTKLRDYKGALADWDKAIALSPRNNWAWNQRALTKMLGGDAQAALADLNEVIGRSPEDNMAFLNRGQVKEKLGDTKGALADYGAGIKLSPKFEKGYEYRAALKEKLGDAGGAKADRKLIEEIKSPPVPKEAAELNNSAVQNMQAGDYASALDNLNQALKLAPTYDLGYVNRAIAKNTLKDYPGALADLDIAMSMRPNAHRYSLRGQVKIGLKDYRGALADLNEAIRLQPNIGDYYETRAVARQQLGDAAGAKADTAQAKKLSGK